MTKLSKPELQNVKVSSLWTLLVFTCLLVGKRVPFKLSFIFDFRFEEYSWQWSVFTCWVPYVMSWLWKRKSVAGSQTRFASCDCLLFCLGRNGSWEEKWQPGMTFTQFTSLVNYVVFFFLHVAWKIMAPTALLPIAFCGILSLPRLAPLTLQRGNLTLIISHLGIYWVLLTGNVKGNVTTWYRSC